MPEEPETSELHSIAGQVLAGSHFLRGQAGPSLRHPLQTLLRSMNSYYTNKIEGQNTRPAEIEAALHKQFNASAVIARKQRLAVAHLEAEIELEAQTDALSDAEMFSPDTVQQIHRTLYSRLPQADRTTDEGKEIIPGAFREENVRAGYHVAPLHEDIEGLLSVWFHGYSRIPGGEKRLIGVGCAHHRLAYIHPFLDGNGRTARLHSHLVLHHMRLTGGLWSVMRGLARNQEAYFTLLNNADLPRRHDADGRGALSQAELVLFAKFFLQTCLDQVEFMSGLLQLDSLRERVKDLVVWLEQNPGSIPASEPRVTKAAVEALQYVMFVGPLERGRFIAMMGVGERLGRRILASLLAYGILRSSSPRAAVEFAIPLHALRFLFPRLWPEAESDAG